jgi:ABC-type multidrug transport system ATPase subunit
VTSGQAVTVTALTKRYGKTAAVEDLSFSLPYGGIAALLGPNGAGKTTTFKCLLGITNFEGQVHIGGASVREDGRKTRRLIGYIPQTPAFDSNDTAETTLKFLAELKGAEQARIRILLERVNLWDERRMKVGQLSGGMRQRLALAAALLADPPVLLLDEPTANLDYESRRSFHDLLLELRDEGKSILFSTHFLESVHNLAGRYILLERGRLALDMTAEQLAAGAKQPYVVDLNGTAPAAFLSALAELGIERGRVRRDELDLEAALARVLASRRREETE